MEPEIENQQSKILEWELLPPEEKKRRASLEPIFKYLALIMDEFLRIPGTNLRFGLDPIVGLIPGLGDTASALTSAFALIYAARCGVPRIILARMSVNILINEIVGIIPGLGDAFSFWFKSNVRNYHLLQRHLGTSPGARRSDWIFVFAVLGILFFVVAAGIAVSFLMIRELLRLLQ